MSSGPAAYQYDLFGGVSPVDRHGRVMAHARAGDPQTSHDAARSVDADTMRALHIIQLRLLSIEPDTHSGLWGKYLAHRDDMDWPIVSLSGFRTRVSELVHAAFVEDSGRRAVLPTGRRSVIWRVTESGATALDRRNTAALDRAHASS